MSCDNLLSEVAMKFYSEKMTQTQKIFYVERKFQELNKFIENIIEAA